MKRECKWYRVCPMKRYYGKGLIEEKWVRDYCHGDWQNCVRYAMEEKGLYHEDWMLPDGTVRGELKNS